MLLIVTFCTKMPWTPYRATVTGNAMAMSKKLPPLTRASAEALLERVISTAHEINADPDMAYDITYLAVFGS